MGSGEPLQRECVGRQRTTARLTPNNHARTRAHRLDERLVTRRSVVPCSAVFREQSEGLIPDRDRNLGIRFKGIASY